MLCIKSTPLTLATGTHRSLEMCEMNKTASLLTRAAAVKISPSVTDAWISACFFVGAGIDRMVMTACFLKIVFSVTWANWRWKAERNWHYRIWVYDPQTKLRVLLSFSMMFWVKFMQKLLYCFQSIKSTFKIGY